jgi:cytochrome c peroxidase
MTSKGTRSRAARFAAHPVTLSPCHLVIFLLLVAGCQKAGRSRVSVMRAPESGSAEVKEAGPSMDPDLQWQDPGRSSPRDEVRIEFVHAESSPQEWGKLPLFWNTGADQVAALLGLHPLTGALAAGQPPLPVRIKVPLGLDDPRPYVPASNPLTLGKWKLGRKLFFDDTWLAKGGVSCAGCHKPQEGFTDRQPTHPGGFNAPTLLNAVYNRYQFWDGRASLLEEVVQRSLKDEYEDPPTFQHTWSGAIRRLRADDMYLRQFDRVFRTPPTQDAVGRALATYLRTLLAGYSVHDRARVVQTAKGARSLEPAHYETVLDAAALEELGQAGKNKSEVARDLHHGYVLFSDRSTQRRTNCIDCHSGRNFTDGEFHNLGIGPRSPPSKEGSRFATVPIGQKDRYLIGACKTPTLRSLLRTRPYLHDGSQDSLANAVAHHTVRNEYLEPMMFDAEDHVYGDDLKPEEIAALVLFLRALNGQDADAVVRTPSAE